MRVHKERLDLSLGWRLIRCAIREESRFLFQSCVFRAGEPAIAYRFRANSAQISTEIALQRRQSPAAGSEIRPVRKTRK